MRTAAVVGCVALALACLQLAAGVAIYDPRKPFFGADPETYRLRWSFTPVTATSGATTGNLVSPFNATMPAIRFLTVFGCGATVIHSHPRATEHIVVISGDIQFGIWLEEGQFITVNATAGEGIILPVGSIHYARSLRKCTNTTMVVVFDHPDPGQVQIPAAIARIPVDVVRSNFNTTSWSAPFPNTTMGGNFRIKGCRCDSGK